MNPLRWLRKKLLYSLGFGVVVLLAISAVAFYFIALRTRPVHVVKIGYGAGAGVRRRFLEQMAARGRTHGLDIRLVPTDSTDTTLSLIDRNEIDLGLVAGALEDRASRHVLEVAPLYMEPLQLLVKNELYDKVSKDFGQLRGKTVGLDSESSSTNLLASELLRFIGLTDHATGKLQYTPAYFPQSRLPEAKDAASLPDAIFQIAGVPSPALRRLITDMNYRLVALPFGSSFSLAEFRDTDGPAAETDNLRLNKGVIEEYVIPAFAYQVLPSVPASDTRTIATRLLIAGRPELDARVVRSVLELIYSPEIANLTKPPISSDLLNSAFEFDRHPATDNYLNSLKPFDVEGVFTTYSRLVEVWGLLLTIYVGGTQAWKWWRARKEDRAGRSVGDFLGEVLAVEAEVSALCSDEDRIRLDARLSEIKKRAIELHVEDGLEDADDLPALLVTLADTRTKIWGASGRAAVS